MRWAQLLRLPQHSNRRNVERKCVCRSAFLGASRRGHKLKTISFFIQHKIVKWNICTTSVFLLGASTVTWSLCWCRIWLGPDCARLYMHWKTQYCQEKDAETENRLRNRPYESLQISQRHRKRNETKNYNSKVAQAQVPGQINYTTRVDFFSRVFIFFFSPFRWNARQTRIGRLLRNTYALESIDMFVYGITFSSSFAYQLI